MANERNYTNSDGMLITVTDAHLRVAIQLKLELQKSSPSMKCAWNVHKKMMEQDGFNDSDTNEAYRLLIKRAQKEANLLPSLVEHANLVSASKLESIRSAVGELYYAKAENSQVVKELNKIRRNLTTSALAVEELKSVYIDDIDFSVPHYIYNPKLPGSKSKAIVIVTDWHIGMVVNNCFGNYYNLDIATKRVETLKREVLDYCNVFNITDVHVVGLGDWIEHGYMRDNQSQDCEFMPSMQIAKAQKLILNFLVSLSEYVNVDYQSIDGNHDRFEGNKNKSFDGDNANVIINEGIKDMISLLKTDRLTLIDTDKHASSFDRVVNGTIFKFAHGHLDSGDKKKRLKAHISMENKFYDVLVHGHLHNWYTQEDDHGRMIIGIGCLQGRNNYSKDLSCATNASQGIIIVREDGEIIPIRIDLQNL